MRKEVLLRRGVHALIALAPLYYWVPVDVPVLGVRRWVLLMAFFAFIVCFEAVRLWKGFSVMGLRPHEAKHIASFVWAAAGITIALWLFPRDIASAALVGMALVDPLAGELRAAKVAKPVELGAPILAYFIIAAVALALFGDLGTYLIIALSVVGAVSAVFAEASDVPVVDDDFLMIVVPCLVMGLVAAMA